MVSSLRRHDPTALLMALCLDQDSEAVLRRLALPGLTPVPLKELEAYDPDLARAKTERDRLEYYFTLSPAINLFALDAEPTGDGVTYLDADLFFFGNPQPLFDEMGDQSVTIIEHGLPARRAGLAAMFGVYNVGWLSFRNDPRARVCLRWWTVCRLGGRSFGFMVIGCLLVVGVLVVSLLVGWLGKLLVCYLLVVGLLVIGLLAPRSAI